MCITTSTFVLKFLHWVFKNYNFFINPFFSWKYLPVACEDIAVLILHNNFLIDQLLPLEQQIIVGISRVGIVLLRSESAGDGIVRSAFNNPADINLVSSGTFLINKLEIFTVIKIIIPMNYG